MPSAWSQLPKNLKRDMIFPGNNLSFRNKAMSIIEELCHIIPRTCADKGKNFGVKTSYINIDRLISPKAKLL